MATEFEKEYRILRDTKIRILDALRNKGLEVGEDFSTYPLLIDLLDIPSSVKFQGSRFNNEIPQLIINCIKNAEGDYSRAFAEVTFNNITLPKITNTNSIDLNNTFERARFEETDPNPIYNSWFINANSCVGMFKECEFRELDIDMSNMNYPNLSSIQDMFRNSMGIKSFSISGTHAYQLRLLNYFLQGTEVEYVDLSNTMLYSTDNPDSPLYLQGMFTDCWNLKRINLTNAFIYTYAFNWWAAFRGCTSLTEIEGVIDVSQFRDFYSDNKYALFSDEEYPNLVKMTLANLGKVTYRPSNPIVDLSMLTGWGTNGNKQCVIDSLITNSKDNSMYIPQVTVKLSENTKALLTEDEIALINAKGYIIE